MNNNDRKRSLSSSVRPLPLPPAKRRDPSSSSRKLSCPPTNNNVVVRRSERTELKTNGNNNIERTKKHRRTSSTSEHCSLKHVSIKNGEIKQQQPIIVDKETTTMLRLLNDSHKKEITTNGN